MSERTRLVVLAAMTVVILLLLNLQIVAKERIVRDGTPILLRLAPVDPRSLLQGDYMALRYSITSEVSRAARSAQVSDGVAIVELGDMNEASFVAIHTGQQIGANQALLRFRRRGDSVRLASDAFFFEEGKWDTYRGARFGEVRVSDKGDAVLTGLRDAEGRLLGVPLQQGN